MVHSTEDTGTDIKQACEEQAPKKPLSPAAQRALAEAEERRRAAGEQKPGQREIGGPKGLEPVRYGDWEKNGIAWDF
jgi:hypothetical protein